MSNQQVSEPNPLAHGCVLSLTASCAWLGYGISVFRASKHVIVHCIVVVFVLYLCKHVRATMRGFDLFVQGEGQ